jgi:hypothetical protein
VDHRNYGMRFIRTRISSDTTKPSVYVLGDSFTNSFFPFLAQGFGRSYHAFDLWHYSLAPYSFTRFSVEEKAPDVFILMVYEGHLVTVPQAGEL